MSFPGNNPPINTPSFGQMAPQTTNSGFTFGSTIQPSGGFSFGTTPSTATTTIPVAGASVAPFSQMSSFGSVIVPPATTTSSSGFGFSTSTASSALFGGNFRATTTTSTSTMPGNLSFGGATTGFGSTPSSAGFTFGQQPTTSVTALSPFGMPASTAPTQTLQLGNNPLSLGGFSTNTSVPNSSSSFANIPVTSSANAFAASTPFAIPSSTPATTAPIVAVTTVASLPLFGTSLSTPQPPKTTTLPAVTVAPLTTSTAVTTAELALTRQLSTTTATTTPSFTTTTAATFSTTSVTPTTTSETTSQSSKSMTFSQLEESINKWNAELEEQERIFLSQATQVNAWDRLLISNGEKITVLNESVERVKLEQQRLDHELDFIVAQQRELEELLSPLEKSVDASPSLSIQQHADLEREHTYHLAENIDGQLKRMSEDIKKIIEHLNTVNHEDENEPMQQISKILNAHMDALQWIDHNTGMLQKKMDEATKMLETTRKDHEMSYKIGYD